MMVLMVLMVPFNPHARHTKHTRIILGSSVDLRTVIISFISVGVRLWHPPSWASPSSQPFRKYCRSNTAETNAPETICCCGLQLSASNKEARIATGEYLLALPTGLLYGSRRANSSPTCKGVAGAS